MAFGIKRNATDALFSDCVREIAGWKCERCGKQYVKKESLGGSGLECSHYWSRRNRSVRWDFENAASLCSYCHRLFTENPSLHHSFFIKRLGQEKYEQLGIRARTPTKLDEKEIRANLRQKLKDIRGNHVVFKDYH